MSSIKTTQIDGDVSVGRNVAIGGKARVAGSATIGHNLKVEGWLEAKNIKGVNKGVFTTVTKLREAYPTPHDGWFAGVGTSSPFTAYVGDGGEWVATSGTITIDVDMTQYTEEVEQLSEDIAGVKSDIEDLQDDVQEINNALGAADGIATLDENGKLDSDQVPTNLATTTQLAEVSDAASAAAQGVETLTGKLGAANGIATLDSSGKLTSGQIPLDVARLGQDGKLQSSQVPSNIPTLTDGKLPSSVIPENIATLTDGKLGSDQIPNDVARLGQDGKLLDEQMPDLSDLDDTIEFSGVLSSATIVSGTSTKKSTDNDAQVFYVTALKQFVLGVRTDVLYSSIFAINAPMLAPAIGEPAVVSRLTDAQIKEAIAMAGFPTLYEFYLDWADRELYSNDQLTPHNGKTFICTSTDTSYYWKSSVPGLQPMGKDFTEDIAEVQSNIDAVEATVSSQGDAISDLQDIATIMIDLWDDGAPTANDWALNRIYYDATGKKLYRGTTGEVWTDISTELNTGRIFVDKSNNISYRWSGSDMEAISTKDVPAAIYNPTVLDPLSDKGLDGYYELVNMNETGRSAVHSAWDNGKAVAGLIISFKISSTVWKTYQYIGASVGTNDWHDATNWQDFGNLAKGSEGYININATLKTGNVAYDTASALEALHGYELSNNLSYAKLGMIISYITSTVDNTVEAKIYAGKSLSDFYEPGLWINFGGGSVETSDTPEEDGTDPFSTGGAYSNIPTTIAKTSTEQEELAGTIKLQLRNAGGSGIGSEVTFAVGTGGGGGSSSTFNITFQEGTRIAANVDSTVTLHACIRSVSAIGDDITLFGIQGVNIYNANTNTLLKSYDFDGQTSSAAGTYDFPMDISDLFKTAGRTYLKIVATDMNGNSATTYFNAVCVDVSILAANSLTYIGSSVRVGGGEQNLDSFYKFPVNTSGSITAYAEIYVNGSWISLGTSEVRSTYTQSLSLNPDNIDGHGTALTHGAYPLRLHGIDASGVVGNYLHTAVMVIDDGDTTPIIVSRWYTNSASGTIRCFDNIEIEYASYSSGSNPLSIDIYENNALMRTVNSYRTSSGTYKHQVTSPSGSIVVSFRCGSVQSQSAEWTINGSVIDAALTGGAIFAFDFANRSNSDADKSIVSGDYSMTVHGANWSSNGFGTFLGANCLAVKNRMQVGVNSTPFSSTSGIATSGFALLLKFASQYAIDDDAKLLSCFSADANDNPTGAGFYITGNKVVIYSNLGEPQVAERRYPAGKMVTVGITVDPSDVYISNGGVRYCMMRLYLDGDLVGCVGYPSTNASSALIQESNIIMDGTNANFYLYYMIGWRSYPVYREMFNNYLVKLTEATEMVAEYNFENVFTDGTDRPVANELYSRGMPYIIEAPLGTYNGDAVSQDMTAPDKTTSTKSKTYIDLFYYNPAMPWRNFVSVNTQRRNQGTTSTKRPVKNSRYYLGAGKGSSNYGDGKTHLYSIAEQSVIASLTNAQRADYELWLKLLKANKVRVGANSIPVDIITVKVDYSDSTNANDCGVCNMMNATYRALGDEYLTPAQRHYNGTYTFTYKDDENVEHTETITGLELNHSTANHPVAVFRSLSGGTTSLTMYAKGNWKEDKNESKALGFYGTPGYNAGCHSYQESDFVEWVAPSNVSAIGDASTPGTAVYVFLNSFASGHAWDDSTEKNPDKLYLVTLYCGSSYRFMRYNAQTESWYDSTGNYSQDSNGVWQISAGVNNGTDVLNPVDGFELREYASMCWFRDVANVTNMMQLVTSTDGTSQHPKWLNYFESMIDCDALTALYENGHKVPYWLYRFLLFCNSVSDTEDGSANASAQRTLWRNNAYKYMKIKPLMVYNASTDYNALVDQQSKNMQPMFFLDDGGSVTGGDYDDETLLLMYPNKVYDADGANGKDNETVASVDPEVDPNKPDDANTGYTNPYAGKNSVLWRNLYHQPEVVFNDANSTVTMRSVVAAMRSLNLRVDDGFTGSPFSPEGAKHFFIEQICKRWQKTVSGYDGENKFINAKELDADGNETGTVYFKSVYGLRLTELDEYISTRWRQRDGFFGCGAFTASYLNFRTGAGIASTAGITIKAAKSGYFGIGYQTPGSVSESVYLEAGESHRFTDFSHEDNSDTYIYQPDRILELDLSEIVVTNTASFASCTLLKKLYFGGATHDESIAGANAFITNLALGELPFLEWLDIRKTHITNVNASGCPRLESLLATDTSLVSLELAETSPIATLSLPATISRLTLVNLPNLSYGSGCLSFEGMSSLTQIRIDGCPLLNGAALLNDVIAAGATLTHIRLAGIDVTGKSDILVALRNMGVRGIDANGVIYSETNQCSGLTGVWTCSDVIDTTLLTQLQAYFPELDVYNAQYTVIKIDETKTAPAEDSIVNMDNGTYANDGRMGYIPSGHISKIKSMLHVYKSEYDSATQKMMCTQIDDDDIELLADGTSFDRTDGGGQGYDVMLGLPHFWYKGINDHINQKKYLVLSGESSTPRSSSRLIKRDTLDNLLLAELSAVSLSQFNVGDVFATSNLTASSTMNVYRMNVEGCKQVRWPSMTSTTIGVLFLDKDNKVISKYAPNISNSMSDFLSGDYVFMAVPANAVYFVFSTPVGFDDSECIAVDSTEVEAIEPDWVEHNFELIGTYKAYKDAYHRLRSVSGVTPTRGSGTSTTSSYWQYDVNGNCVSSLPDSSRSFNMTYLDFRNLSRCRGAGFQLVDYEMHKCVDLLFMATFGTRNSQSLFGNGQGTGAQTGGSDIVITNLERDASPLREASRPRFFGLEDWWGNAHEWMDFVAVNVSSYDAFYKNRCEAPTGSPTDRTWRVRMPDGTERLVKGDPNTNSGEIVRLRWGRFCDVVPSKLTTNNSYNTYYCDQQELANSTGRVVSRSGYSHYAHNGFVCVYAVSASSNSSSYNGSRLAFRGEIEIVE